MEVRTARRSVHDATGLLVYHKCVQLSTDYEVTSTRPEYVRLDRGRNYSLYKSQQLALGTAG